MNEQKHVEDVGSETFALRHGLNDGFTLFEDDLLGDEQPFVEEIMKGGVKSPSALEGVGGTHGPFQLVGHASKPTNDDCGNLVSGGAVAKVICIASLFLIRKVVLLIVGVKATFDLCIIAVTNLAVRFVMNVVGQLELRLTSIFVWNK